MRALAVPVNAAGGLVLVGGAAVMHSRILAADPYDLVSDPRLAWWMVLALVLTAVSYAYGLPELATSRVGAAGRGLAAVITAFVILAVIQTVLATPLLPRSSSMIVGLTIPVWSVLSWNLAVDAGEWTAGRDRIFAVVANTEDVATLRRDLARNPERPATVVGHMLTDEATTARAAEPELISRFRAAGANILVMDAASHAVNPVIEQAAVIHRQGCRIRTLALFYEEWIGKLPHAELARISLLFDVGELHRRRYVRAKRVVDVALALVGMAALVPLAAAVLVANPFLNPGPLLFRQTRVGKDGVPFTILKLRTMRPAGAERSEPGEWTATDDVRITPLGRWLRRSHLDELPQVLNILGGDLSVVGPRPEQPHYVERLSDKIDFFDVRHIVRPGLTGWAQVKQGYAGDDDDAFDKLQYDFYYLRRQGVGLDARIIWRTARGVLAGDGR